VCDDAQIGASSHYCCLSLSFDVSERKGWAVIDTAFCFIAYGLVQGDQLPLILLFDG